MGMAPALAQAGQLAGRLVQVGLLADITGSFDFLLLLMKRAGQPSEVAPCYVFLASADGSYMTGQVLNPNGGDSVSA